MTREQLASALARSKLHPDAIGKAIDRSALLLEHALGIEGDFEFGVAFRQAMSRAFAEGLRQIVFFAARDELMWRSMAEDKQRNAARRKEPKP